MGDGESFRPLVLQGMGHGEMGANDRLARGEVRHGRRCRRFPGRKGEADELTGACSGRVCNLAGKTTLAELAGVLHLSRLHIGVDSAAPHIAAAVGTPTVTLYGPADWRYRAPPGERHRVVVSGMECAPCNQKGCEGLGVEPLPRRPDRGAGSGCSPRDPFGLTVRGLPFERVAGLGPLPFFNGFLS
ncbi:MAG: glycosyltransferase family 9 protein [Desulfobacterales bacterium]|nr:glycosyltransferase family 9 protein [Desulfobacterales bacterium]